MARIRTIKPEFWSSPDTAACADPWERLLYIAMWNWADDCGRGTAIPKELAGFAFPNDEWISSADIRRMLGGIRRAFGVDFYTVAGRPYYAIPSWDSHQKIDRRSAGKHPGPDEGEDWDPDPSQPPDLRKQNGSKYPAEHSAETHEFTPSTRRIPGAGTGEQGNRGTGEVTTPRTADAARKAADLDAGFEAFWTAFPRKRDKADALKAWRSAIRTKRATAAQLILGAETYARERAGQDITKTKYPATWINKGSFDNVIEQPARPDVYTTDDRIAYLQSLKTQEPGGHLYALPAGGEPA